ncbi:flagellar motor switch protein FliG [Histidinibacterium aquaticum]|uniref:Flagellar motor switch protein FliG n=1 Tax=Histidinibacterium aquaticum TaxID=2613962 RepID=A0A5J5GMH9_9RHOB|nr:flagellar motor switch protein FliG [Histidinibacterium aquaticum]
MIVQIASAEGHKLPLDRLSDEAQMSLAREIAQMPAVDRETLEQVAGEFSAELERIGLTAPSSMEEALTLLDGQISPRAAAALREEHERMTGADPWPRVLALPPEDLKPIMESESTEVSAVVLSKLPVAKAAELLGRLPGELARRITYAVSRTKDVSPGAVYRIGLALAETYGRPPSTAFTEKPGRRLGAILNSSGAQTRDEVLDSLRSEDPEFAEEVRKAIFTFHDLPRRLRKEDLAKVIRLVDGVDLTTALAAGLAEGGDGQIAADFVLDSISQRMAAQLRDEIAERGRVKKSEAETAQTNMITSIREAADMGEITLVSEDEEED